MILSEMRDWQGDTDVKQVLVFWNREEKERFDFRAAAYFSARGHEANENCFGAIAKVRAVKRSDGTWEAIVRNGSDGSLLDASDERFIAPEQAIQRGLKLLQQMAFVPKFDTNL